MSKHRLSAIISTKIFVNKMNNKSISYQNDDSELLFADEDVSVNQIADFELEAEVVTKKKSKHNEKRNYLAKKKIEELQEERRMKKFDEYDYDDWD